MSDELLLEIGLEYLKHASYYSNASYRAEAAARTALELRETGQAHKPRLETLLIPVFLSIKKCLFRYFGKKKNKYLFANYLKLDRHMKFLVTL